MMFLGSNAYERAFEGRLRESGVRFARVDQTRRCVLDGAAVKTFDYLLSLADGGRVLVELKGRRFTGDSLAGRKGLGRWVFEEDVASLTRWQRAFCDTRPDVRAAFIFAYQLDGVAVDTDGLEIYYEHGRRYVFLAIMRQDYQRWMRCRSPRWKTVTCPAAAFGALSFPAERLWLGEHYPYEYNHSETGRDGAGRAFVVGTPGRAPLGGGA